MLQLAKRYVMYRYIRTEKELTQMLIQFQGTGFRYLHLACHGNSTEIALTFDTIPLRRLADLLIPHLDRKRLFISACHGAHRSLAGPVLTGSGCYSVIGPTRDIDFQDVVVAWASFYTLMSKADPDVMKRKDIQANLQRVCDLFRVSFDAFFRGNDPMTPTRIRPS